MGSASPSIVVMMALRLLGGDDSMMEAVRNGQLATLHAANSGPAPEVATL